VYQAFGGELICLELAFELEDAVVVLLEVAFAGNYDFHIIECINYEGRDGGISAFLYRLLIRKVILSLSFTLRSLLEAHPN